MSSHKAEVMAKRFTYDNKKVLFWTDGRITGPFSGVKGAGAARSKHARKRNIEAAWLLAGEVELYAWGELPCAVEAARFAVRNTEGGRGNDDTVQALKIFRHRANSCKRRR